tara:strand:- start:998 stop:1171 length:174 start_codon:yes stop_codon:yes gene_type:complete
MEYSDTIGLHTFEYANPNITVYRRGDFDPIAILDVGEIDEKTFHYEIMNWYTQFVGE